MRFTTSIIALAALLSCSAETIAPARGYVYTLAGVRSTSTSGRRTAQSLSADTVRIVLAQRAGVEDFHITHGLTEEEITAINEHGRQTSFFSAKSQQKRAILLTKLGSVPTNEDADIVIADSPNYDETLDMWADLLEQAYPSVTDGSAYLSDKSTYNSIEDDAAWFQVRPESGDAWSLAKEMQNEGVEVTIVMVPEGKTTGSWGTYEMPNAASYLQKRAPRRLEEKPLSVVAEAMSTPQLLASNSSSNHSNNKPFEGIVPACYKSQETCESKTRGCTGHGKCQKKYTNSASKNHPECWSCFCNATQSNGLTTYWAGPACQKKDISVEFWLVALFTVGLVSLVTFAVGTIWSMGEEQLPSVIGAGVSGPTARK